MSAPLLKVGANSYAGSITTSASGGNVVAFVAARDAAGNVATQALKGTLSSAFSLVYLPAARR